MATRADLLDRLRFNLLQKNPDVCLQARAAAQLNPEGLAASIWDALDASEQAEERLLWARARGFQPGDWDEDARLCTCGRWQRKDWLSIGINPCYDCMYEATAPWQTGYWRAAGTLTFSQPAAEWAKRFRRRMGYIQPHPTAAR